jgi:hypothetical protein
MATQGLVSVVVDGEVVCKVIAGDNGFNAKNVAEYIRHWVHKDKESIVQHAYLIHYGAREISDFGCEACLVTMTPVSLFYDYLTNQYGNSKDWSLYIDTFNDPNFNPRWDVGTADYVEIVEFRDGKLVDNTIK